MHSSSSQEYNIGILMKNISDNFNNKNFKKEINLIYKGNGWGLDNIFGDKFYKNNKDNIDLEINGEKMKLIKIFKLKKDINKIKMIIRNKIKNLEGMFFNCKRLTNIDELKYLDTKEINNFSHIFSGCSSLSSIK